MADEPNNDDQVADSTKKSSLGLVLWLVVCVVSLGAGFAIPYLTKPGSTEQQGTSSIEPVSDEPTVFVDFGEVVSNLNEPRLNRYLRLKISLMVNASQKVKVAERVEKNKANLVSWLLSSLADKRLDDIRGRTGQNRLRNEIQNHFNDVLFPEGYQNVKGVLFEEFNIQ